MNKKRPRRNEQTNVLGEQTEMLPQQTPEKVESQRPVQDREAVLTQFLDLEGKLLLVRVNTEGLDINQADQEINKVATQLEELLERHGVQCMALVTHHLVDMHLVESSKG